MTYRGLTWDHPRGYQALDAAADRAARRLGRPLLHWSRQPLKGFESHPIEELAADYDLLIIDHPHVGGAVTRDCLLPLEVVFDPGDIADWQTRMIGRATESYFWAGQHWALPLDVATQVMASRPDLLGEAPPRSWDEVAQLAERCPVALALAGPHAWVTMLAVCAALGAEVTGENMLPAAIWAEAWRILAHLHTRSPRGTDALNPIGLLETMAESDRIALIPLVYGYVTYAVAVPPRHAVAFDEAPRTKPEGRRGSVLGGTGIAITRRALVSPELREHLTWLLSDEAQTSFISDHGGQPAARAAWRDEAVNARWAGFYQRTAATIADAIVRPRHAGYVSFQDHASEVVREGLRSGADAGAVRERLCRDWQASLASDATRGADAQP